MSWWLRSRHIRDRQSSRDNGGVLRGVLPTREICGYDAERTAEVRVTLARVLDAAHSRTSP